MEGITKTRRTAALLLAASALTLAACDGRDAPTAAATPEALADAPASITMASEAQQQNLVDREQALAQREAVLTEQRKAVDADIARREAQIAAATTEARNARLAAERAAQSAQSSAPVLREPPEEAAASADADEAYGPAAQRRLTVPAGTALEITLATALDTRKAHVGDVVEGSLASPIIVEDVRAVEPGARVYGTVTEVVSGGAKIGGVPTLGLAFDSLTAEDGSRVPISARYVQQAKSETGKDAAKILGGAAAGAVVGHQVEKNDKGTIIGGILGGAAGAAAAKNTGGEVTLPTGAVISATTASSFQVER